MTVDYPRLIARFRPQAWQHDYANDVDGAVEFDATVPFLALPLDRIREFKEHDHDSDALADYLDARWEHNGPFEVDVDVDAWLEANGIDHGRDELTAADLATLRERFGVAEGQRPDCLGDADPAVRLDLEQLRAFANEVLAALYPDGPDTEWTADTPQAVADVLRKYGLAPQGS